ncbi:MAG TPA: peptidoglycan-binding domain-containing protein [Candidatus Binatia bacterium]|nr:peptidoglycan-binding domain-containing protein [Candidatus Binatia bacterium]
MVAVLGAAACSKEDVEARARDAADKNRASIPDVEGRALAQPVTKSDVKAVQAQLTKLNEYQGEIDGNLDLVTVSAIQAFQRSQGLQPDGLLTSEVKQRLHDATAKQPRS